MTTATAPTRNEILLESGTNELEVLVFGLAGQKFGVNVAKVREVITSANVTASPSQPDTVKGMFDLRGVVLPLVDLHRYLSVGRDGDGPTDHRIIVTEFNGQQAAFEVESVDSIYRISWQKIRPVPEGSGSDHVAVTGIAEIGDQLVMMLDFESIFDHISMSDGLHIDEVENTLGVDRGACSIVLAEDSHFIRRLMEKLLANSGYTDVSIFTNGLDAWNHLSALADTPDRLPDIVVTDIEMPQMDGLHLTRRLRTLGTFDETPVLLFSSLITDDTRHKGAKVGADAQLAKPDLHRLVQTVDRIVSLGREGFRDAEQ